MKPLRLGIIGNPVKQCKSPKLFYETFADNKDVMTSCRYDLIEEDTFKRAFERFRNEYDAVNVTAPYKEPAFRAADEASELCRGIRATNLLVHRDGRIIAHNTDCMAVVEILQNWTGGQESHNGSSRVGENGTCEPDSVPYSPPAQTKVLVVGCGGAGKAAIVAALSTGATVTIANRTPETIGKFIAASPTLQKAADRIRTVPLAPLPEEVRKADFIIYTLPLAIPELKECDFTGHTVLEAKYYDTSIKPMPGMTYVPGTEWLRLQAIATYRILGLLP